MGMAEMRGLLADAIRDSHIANVKKQLVDYEKREGPEYLEKRRDKTLKDAERLARRMQRYNAQILEALEAVQAARRTATE